MKPEAEEEYSQLAREVMEIVLDVAARRLEQALKEVHDSRIAPLRAQIAAKDAEIEAQIAAKDAALRQVRKYLETLEANGVPVKVHKAFVDANLALAEPARETWQEEH